MATVNTNTANNDNLIMSYFERKALVTLTEKCLFYQIADKTPLPKGSGKSVTFNGWVDLDGASSVLSEHSASANAVVTLSSRKVNVTISGFGRGIKWTETLELTSILPVEPGALAMLENSAAKTVDRICQFAALKNKLAHTGNAARCLSTILSAWMSSKASAFCSNTSTASYNANSTSRFGFPVVFAASCTTLSGMHAASAKTFSISGAMGPIGINKAVARLARLNVPKMANGRYAGITNPNAISTMRRNSDWKAWRVNFAEGVKESFYKATTEVVLGVELMESAYMPRYEGSLQDNEAPNLNLTLIVGQGALGMTELDGGIKYILHSPDKSADPFELCSTLTYKVRAAACVLNPSAGVILISQDVIAPVTVVA